MDIKTSELQGYEESQNLYATLRKETEECIAAVGAIADAGDTTVLKERLKEILFLAEELEAKGKAYNETVLKKRFIAEQYSRMTLKG